MRKGNSYFIPNNGPNANAIDQGIQWLSSQSCPEKLIVLCGIKNANSISCSLQAKEFFNSLYKATNHTVTFGAYGKFTLVATTTPLQFPSSTARCMRSS